MAFNLKKVLKALLFSTNQPLSVRDIQSSFSRFHEQASLFLAQDENAEDAPPGGEPQAETVETPAVPEAAPVANEETADLPVEPLTPGDEDIYQDVPSLITAAQIREAMAEISAELRAADDGLLLIESSGGFRLVTHPRFGRWLRILRDEPPPVKLSQSSIETLAVIAYRQPVTRTEIETIRGVSAEAGVSKLLERELIYIVGRADLPGRPIQYGTTDQFLEFVGVKSLDELPASDVLSNRQIDQWMQTAMNPNKPSDADMGLPQEHLPLDAEEEVSAVNTSLDEPADERIADVANEKEPTT